MDKAKIKTLVKIHQFIHEIEGLKRLLRHSWLSDDRRESVAEQTWRMAMMALLFHEEIEVKVDIHKVIKMILIHDLAEVYAGDYVVFKHVPKDKHELEFVALQKLVKTLPQQLAEEFVSLWQEFEDKKTNEGKFATALDKLEVIIQHNEAKLESWEEKEYSMNYYYAYDEVKFSEVLTVFRDLVLVETIEKIEREV